MISWLKEEGDGWDLNEFAEAEVAGILAAIRKPSLLDTAISRDEEMPL